MSADAGSLSVAELQRTQRSRLLVLVPLGVVTAAVAGAIVADMAKTSKPILAFVLPLFLVPVVLWRRPRAGLFVVLTGTVVIEQFAYTVGPRKGAVTASVPFFHSITPGSGITPAEMFLFLFVLIWAMKTVAAGGRLLPRSPLLNCFAVLLAFVVLYLVLGLARSGTYKIAIWEMRPWFYLVTLYVLAASLMTTRSAVRAMLWIFVIGSAGKAAYGIDIWMSIRNLRPRPEAVLAHEESFFFGLYIFLTVALWIFGLRLGRLRMVASLLLPVVVFGDMTNSRRTAWAIVGCGLLAMIIIAYARLPARRPILNRVGLVVLAVSVVYFPAYWNSDGTVGQPARALHSAIAPSPRDKASNLYRDAENLNLVFNIRAKHDLGSGFGQRINYVVPITNLTNIDSSIDFVPHNGVLYVWMRMGILGEIVLWLVVSAALIRCCRLAKTADPEAVMLGALTAAAVVAYVVMGYEDMGFFWFRLALCVGALLGAVEARLRVGPQKPSASTTEATPDLSTSPCAQLTTTSSKDNVCG